MSALDHIEARVREAREGAPYAAYLEAREHVLRLLEGSRSSDASAYWREELEGFEYLLDAHPLVVEKLRHHSYHVTGLRPYEYRTNKVKNEEWMSRKRAALLERGRRELYVPEHPALGGFGFRDEDGELFNIDTLKYFEVLIALDEGAVLAELERVERPVVWEIGAGWGGLAYVMKTLFPQVTYAVVDLPELFLFSATYLRTVFPDAKIVFFDPDDPEAAFRDWEAADFVFFPHTALEHFRPPRLDLALNTVSFQEMTTEQVQGYVDHAAELGAPYLYSLNRDRSIYNDELSSVREIIARRYRLREIPILPVSYVQPLPPERKPKKAPAKKAGPLRAKASKVPPAQVKADDYRHVVGWLRRP